MNNHIETEMITMSIVWHARLCLFKHFVHYFVKLNVSDRSLALKSP